MKTALALTTILACGCGSQATVTKTTGAPLWSASVTQLTEYPSITGDLFTYTPDSGYVWAEVTVTVTNITNTERCINWLEDHFDYTHAGQTYLQHLQYESDLPGYLPTCYLPGESKSGYVVFELSAGQSVSGDEIDFLARDSNGTAVINGSWSVN